MKNYYDILGIQRTASASEIKQAYRTMAVIYHPDKNQGNLHAEEKFKEINEAYQVLSDIGKKSNFDLILNYNLNSQSKSQYTYHPNEKTQTRRNPSPRSAYQRSYTSPEPQLSFEDSIRNLSEKNFIRVGFIVVLIISTIIGVAEYSAFQRKEKVKNLAEAQTILLNTTKINILNAIETGDFKNAFIYINQVNNQLSDQYEIDQLNRYAVDSLTRRALSFYNNRMYDEANKDYSILLEQRSYDDGKTPLMYGKCLIELHQEEEAYWFFTEVVQSWEYNPQINYELARLAYKRNALEVAATQISIAEDLLKKRYIRTFGKFYFFNARNDNIPYFHYEIYMLHAEVQEALENTERALQSYRWAEFLQPKLPQPLVFQANIEYELGNTINACSLYKSAVELGYDKDLIQVSCGDL